jgi:hypothetical protein
MMRPGKIRLGLPAHVLWLLKDHAAEADQQNPCVNAALTDGVAFIYAADDPFFVREVLHARDHHRDPAAREAGWQLAHDHARLRAGRTPRDADLAEAPTLLVSNAYIARLIRGPAPASQAVLIGRPLDPYGLPAPMLRVTSLLIAVEASEGRWARTFNRFYRLMHDDGETNDPRDYWPEDGR